MFLKSLRNGIQSTNNLGLVRLDLALIDPARELVVKLNAQLVILLTSLLYGQYQCVSSMSILLTGNEAFLYWITRLNAVQTSTGVTRVCLVTFSVKLLSGLTVQRVPPLSSMASDAVADDVLFPIVSKTYFKSGATSLMDFTTLESL